MRASRQSSESYRSNKPFILPVPHEDTKRLRTRAASKRDLGTKSATLFQLLRTQAIRVRSFIFDHEAVHAIANTAYPKPVTWQTVRRQIEALEEAGLIERVREGRSGRIILCTLARDYDGHCGRWAQWVGKARRDSARRSREYRARRRDARQKLVTSCVNDVPQSPTEPLQGISETASHISKDKNIYSLLCTDDDPVRAELHRLAAQESGQTWQPPSAPDGCDTDKNEIEQDRFAAERARGAASLALTEQASREEAANREQVDQAQQQVRKALKSPLAPCALPELLERKAKLLKDLDALGFADPSLPAVTRKVKDIDALASALTQKPVSLKSLAQLKHSKPWLKDLNLFFAVKLNMSRELWTLAILRMEEEKMHCAKRKHNPVGMLVWRVKAWSSANRIDNEQQHAA